MVSWLAGWSVGLEVMESRSKSTPWGKSGIVDILHGLPVWKVLSSKHLYLTPPAHSDSYPAFSDLFLCFLLGLFRGVSKSPKPH